MTIKAGARTMIREVNGGNGYAGQSSQRLHFGLGAETGIAPVQIRWPSGAVQNAAVSIDRLTTVREGEVTSK